MTKDIINEKNGAEYGQGSRYWDNDLQENSTTFPLFFKLKGDFLTGRPVLSVTGLTSPLLQLVIP